MDKCKVLQSKLWYVIICDNNVYQDNNTIKYNYPNLEIPDSNILQSSVLLKTALVPLAVDISIYGFQILGLDTSLRL